MISILHNVQLNPDEVRHKIDHRLTDRMLPDATVEEFVDEANLEVKDMFPGYASFTTEQNERAKLIVVYHAAYLMMDTVRLAIRESVFRVGNAYTAVSYKDRVQKIRGLMEKHMSHLRETAEASGDDEDGANLFELDRVYPRFPVLLSLNEYRGEIEEEF